MVVGPVAEEGGDQVGQALAVGRAKALMPAGVVAMMTMMGENGQSKSDTGEYGSGERVKCWHLPQRRLLSNTQINKTPECLSTRRRTSGLNE